MSSAATAAQPPGLARDLIALAKPSVTLLVLITTAGGLWMAPGSLSWSALFATLAGTALVVAAANTLNCYLERESDKFMARTKRRPLPAGRMEPKLALAVGLGLALVSVPLLTLLANATTGVLAAIALISYVWVYTPMKQRSPHAVIIGAIPGAMPPLMGWTAVTGSIDWPGLALFGILFVWQIPHFIAISVYREREYTRAGIKTVPQTYGGRAARWHMLVWSLLMVPVSLALVPLGAAGTLYLVIAAALGVGLVALALRGFGADKPRAWARGYFLYTLIYLTSLFAALALDAVPLHV